MSIKNRRLSGAPEASAEARQKRHPVTPPKKGPPLRVAHYDVNPNEVTSIVCGDRVIHLDKGVVQVVVKSAR